MKRPLIRGITLLGGLINHGYEPLTKWDDLPSTHFLRQECRRPSPYSLRRDLLRLWCSTGGHEMNRRAKMGWARKWCHCRFGKGIDLDSKFDTKQKFCETCFFFSVWKNAPANPGTRLPIAKTLIFQVSQRVLAFFEDWGWELERSTWAATGTNLPMPL